MSRTSLVDQLPLALFVALLMGGAVAFFFLAMPAPLLERGVIASGLPALLAAAGPPLGGTARALVAGAAAVTMAGATWIAMSLADAAFQPRRRESRPARKSPSPRRADAHPDAPARRPIFAGSDLGSAIAREEPLVPDQRRGAEIDAAAVAWIEIVEPEDDDTLELVDVVPDDGVPPRHVEQPSIANLMARLEAGAERRAAKAVAAAARRPAPLSTPVLATGRELDNALRNALDELQRMAAR